LFVCWFAFFVVLLTNCFFFESKVKTLKRRDMSEYPSLAELKKAVVEVLRPNSRVPNLFRKEDNSRSERYRCNVTADEAVESMKRARIKEQKEK
jgi:hypothetical protein